MQPLTLIVAASENNVIGANGELPWRLSADLQRFKKLTMGHAIIMGRKTYDSIGRLLPGRTTIIVTRQKEFRVAGALTAHSAESALQLVAGDSQPHVIGGAEIYRLFIPLATEIQLTRVHATIAGDTLLPEFEWKNWRCIAATRFAADKKNNFDYSFEIYRRSDGIRGDATPLNRD